ncbi:MAG: Hpt domain-containing protein, partial [Syntrophorhabdaceae bacterium]|nr:Hpt domain-containing protein [Syntrophorhabdaceae bacterium]
MIDTYKETYLEEANEHLSELEESLLELDETPDDKELIGKVFRSLHTIKGSGAMFGFDDIAAFTHEIETVYDKIRDGKIKVTKEIIDLTLLAKDQIKSMLSGVKEDEDFIERQHEIISGFKKFIKEEQPAPIEVKSNFYQSAGLDGIKEGLTYRIRFKPFHNIFLTGTNPLNLLDELRSLGECKIIAQVDEIPPIESLSPEYCYTYWDIILTTDKGINAIRDVFIFVEDMCELTITVIESPGIQDIDDGYKKIGEILLEKGDVKKEDLQKALSEKKFIGEILVEKGLVTPDKIESALVEQEHIKKVREKSKEDIQTSIKVSADKLDTLVNLVGELVTVQARLSETVSKLYDSELTAIAEEVERLTVEMRDNTLNMRMLPIGTTFGRFRRLVRDLSGE